jgi:hypothetical protein
MFYIWVCFSHWEPQAQPAGEGAQPWAGRYHAIAGQERVL